MDTENTIHGAVGHINQEVKEVEEVPHFMKILDAVNQSQENGVVKESRGFFSG